VRCPLDSDGEEELSNGERWGGMSFSDSHEWYFCGMKGSWKAWEVYILCPRGGIPNK